MLDHLGIQCSDLESSARFYDAGAAVDAFHAAGAAFGAEVLHEPRLWPEYHATYYGASCVTRTAVRASPRR